MMDTGLRYASRVYNSAVLIFARPIERLIKSGENSVLYRIWRFLVAAFILFMLCLCAPVVLWLYSVYWSAKAVLETDLSTRASGLIGIFDRNLSVVKSTVSCSVFTCASQLRRCFSGGPQNRTSAARQATKWCSSSLFRLRCFPAKEAARITNNLKELAAQIRLWFQEVRRIILVLRVAAQQNQSILACPESSVENVVELNMSLGSHIEVGVKLNQSLQELLIFGQKQFTHFSGTLEQFTQRLSEAQRMLDVLSSETRRGESLVAQIAKLNVECELLSAASTKQLEEYAVVMENLKVTLENQRRELSSFKEALEVAQKQSQEVVAAHESLIKSDNGRAESLDRAAEKAQCMLSDLKETLASAEKVEQTLESKKVECLEIGDKSLANAALRVEKVETCISQAKSLVGILEERMEAGNTVMAAFKQNQKEAETLQRTCTTLAQRLEAIREVQQKVDETTLSGDAVCEVAREKLQSEAINDGYDLKFHLDYSLPELRDLLIEAKRCENAIRVVTKEAKQAMEQLERGNQGEVILISRMDKPISTCDNVISSEQSTASDKESL